MRHQVLAGYQVTGGPLIALYHESIEDGRNHAAFFLACAPHPSRRCRRDDGY